eukprot:gene233-4479_t
MQVISENLKDLNFILKNQKSVALYNPISIISDINDYCLKISPEDFGLCSSLLFDKETGILQFSDKSLIQGRQNSLLVLFFKLNLTFSEKTDARKGEEIEPYILEIKKSAFMMFRKDESTKVRTSVILTLKKIIKLRLITDTATFEAKEMLDVLIRETNKSKNSASVKGGVLLLIGIICNSFPDAISIQESKRILKIYMDSLKTQSTSLKPEMAIISNSLKGVAYYLNNFAKEVDDEGSEYVQVLYGYLVKALEMNEGTRYDVCKAGLKLLKMHAYQFKEYLTVDAEKMILRLIDLCDHKNANVKKKGFPALEAFVGQVANELAQKVRDIESDTRTFKFLLSKFKDVLDTGINNKNRLSIAIRSFGQFAAPMNIFLGQKELKNFLISLFKLSDNLFAKNEEIMSESITHLPSFINAFANIIVELNEVDSVIIDYLERIIGVLFLVFPKNLLFPKYRMSIYYSMKKLFVALFMKNDSLSVILSKTVFQGILLTISNKEVLGDVDLEKPLYANYEELWSNFLDPKYLKLTSWGYPWSEFSFGKDISEKFHGVIFDKIMESITQMIDKLDLRCTLIGTDEFEDSEFTPSDVTSHIKPKNPKDFELYLNLIDFCQLFLSKSKSNHFMRWIYVFCKQICEKSLKFPFASGFYKLLTLAMNTCKDLNYFQGVKEDHMVLEESMDSLGISSITKYSCFVLVSKFLKETIEKLGEQKNELLISCVGFILSVPKEFIEMKHSSLALKKCFESGMSYLPLADLALNTLNYWFTEIDSKEVKKCLPIFASSMSDYLKVKGNEKNEENVRTSTARKRTIITFQNDQNSSNSEEITLKSIQRRIVQFFGKIGGDSMILLDSSTNNDKYMSWDTTKHVKFPLPFRDVKPDVFFDSILPRLIELAEKSSDRKTKVAACEFLHSIVNYMIGRNAFSPKSADKPTQFYKIYQKLFPTIIALAADPEKIASQLFEPLVYQLTHWLTQSIQYESKETMALLDAIVDGLNNSQNGAVRDVCANLTNEFLKWAIKHNKLNNVNALIQRLCSNLVHPSAHQRLGAALAFNRMYRTFRECDEIVDKHTFSLLHHSILCLKLSQEDKELSGVNDRIFELVSHLEKIINKRSDLLSKEGVEREVHPNLSDLISWLFSQCSSYEKNSRNLSMKLFTSLCRMLPDFNTEDGPKRWIQSKLMKEGSHSLIIFIERYSVDENVFEQEEIDFKRLSQWISEVEMSIHVYQWLFSTKFLAPHQLFLSNSKKRKNTDEETNTSSSTQIFHKIQMLLKNFEKNLGKMKTKKCSLIMKIVDFLFLMIDKYNETMKQFEEIISIELIQLIVEIVLIPSRIGFNTSDLNVQENLLKFAKNLISTLLKDKNQKTKIIETLKNFIQSDVSLDIFNFNLSNPSFNLDDSTFLFRGYRILNILEILQPALEINVKDLSIKLGNRIFDYDKSITPIQQLIFRELFELCIDFQYPADLLIKNITDFTQWGKSDFLAQKLSLMESNDAMNEDDEQQHFERVKLTTKGEHFYKICQAEIDNFISKDYESFALLVEKSKTNSFAFSVLLNVVTVFLRKKKSTTIDFVEKAIHNNLEKLIGSTNVNEWEFEFSVNVSKLFTLVLQLDATTFLNPKYGNSEIIHKVWIHFLKSKRNSKIPSLFLKLQALRSLEHFIKTEKKLEILKEIRSILNNEFPISHKELIKDSVEYKDHFDLVEHFLELLPKLKSPEFFEKLFPLFRSLDHPLIMNMSNAISRFYKVLDKETILKTANLCLKASLKETLPLDVRESILKLSLKICIENMTENVVINFYEQNIIELVKIIQTKISISMSNDDTKSMIMSQICSYNMLSSMFDNLEAPQIKDSINTAFMQKSIGLTGKEVTEKILRAGIDARKQNMIDRIGNQLQVDYHQSAFNALGSAITCTQTQEKPYLNFLFKDKSNDLWEKIVDTSTQYNFEIETNFSGFQKTLNQFKEQNTSKKGTNNNSISYLSSQYLADSSLSADIPYIGSLFYTTGSKYGEEEEQKKRTKHGDTELELDEINQNPCIQTFLHVIDRLVALFPLDKSTLPTWMNELHHIYVNEDTSLNVKLFITKLILNRPNIFEVYSSYWFEPLVSLASSKNNGGTGIHYFVRDISIMLIMSSEYNLNEIKNSKKLASQLVSYLMKHCSHQRKAILKSNLEIIKLLIEKWKDFITIDKSIILGWICYNEKEFTSKLARLTGLQILGVLLANDILVYNPAIDHNLIKEDKYYEKIIGNLTFNSKEVFESTSEICGMILKQLSKLSNNETFERFTKILIANLSMFFTKGENDKFLSTLHKVSLHFSPLVDHFLPSKIVGILSNLFGKYKRMALQLISWRAEFIDDMFQNIQIYMKQFLSFREEDTQLLMLKIVYKLLRKMSKNQIFMFLEIMNQIYVNSEMFHTTFSEPCRNLYYDILIWLYDNNEEVNKESEITKSILRGMSDESEVIRQKLLDFWNHESRLSSDSLDRLTQLFNKMYSENIKENWLKYSSYLMLNLIHNSPDFRDTKSIFNNELANCEFKEYEIDVSWNSKNQLSTPLFSSQSQDGDDKGIGVVRMTQEAQFSLTQTAGTFKENLFDPSLTQTSLLFVPFKKLNQKEGTSSSSRKKETFDKSTLRSRFNKADENEITSMSIMKATKLKREKNAFEERLKNEKKNKINLYRKYRTGELPDINIPYSEYIIPLQALCLLDTKIAKELLLNLFDSLFPQIQSKMDSTDISKSLIKSIDSMSSLSKDCPPLISFLLDICLSHKELSLSLTPDLIKEIGIKSMNASQSAMLIEEQITRLKRKLIQQKSYIPSLLHPHWIELAKIYKDIGEEDIVKSLFKNKIADSSVTKTAIDDEFNFEFKEALSKFQKGIQLYKQNWNSERTKPNDCEVQFWEEEQYQCLKQLKNWDTISDSLIKDFTTDDKSLSDLWKFSNEDIFPLFIESSLKTKKVQLKNFVKNSFDFPEQKEFLEKNHSIDLAMLSLRDDKIDQVKYYLNRSYDEFIEKWSSLSDLAKNERHFYLQKLQYLVEFEDAISMKNGNEHKIHKVLSHWNLKYPNLQLDDLNLWENILMLRNESFESTVSNLDQKFANHVNKTDIIQSIKSKIESEQVRMFLNGTKAARKQNNLFVAQTFIKKVQSLRNKNSVQDSEFDFFKNMVKLYLIKSNKSQKDWVDNFEKLENYIQNKAGELDLNKHAAEFHFLKAQVYTSLDERMTQVKMDSNSFGTQKELNQKTMTEFRKSIDILEKENSNKLSSSLMKFGVFCNQLYKRNPTEEIGLEISKSYLKSMSLGNRQAAQRFTVVLEILEKYSKIGNVFKEYIDQIPSWMFIDWVSQIIPYLNGNQAIYLVDILINIAEKYPQSIYFPINVSKDDLKPPKSVKSKLDLLYSKLKSPLLEKFIFHLGKLTHPELRLKDWKDKLNTAVKSKNDEIIIAMFNEMYEDLFDPTISEIGSYNEKFAKEYAPKVKAKFGKNGEKLVKMTHTEFAQTVSKVFDTSNRDTKDPKLSYLREFSKWLADYQGSDNELDFIEVPGQYGNMTMTPPSDSIVKVGSIDSKLLLLHSIRLPKRIKINGDDEKEHFFLVKGGEDMRQDQRIEQLFSIMNNILKTDHTCHQRNLTLNTYSVIPLSKNVGMVEWVQNTAPMKEILDKQYSIATGTNRGCNIHGGAVIDWFSKSFAKRSASTSQIYIKMYEKATKDVINNKMKELWSEVPKDLLINGLKSLCASNEAYFTIRNRFTRSVSTVNICSYILGIGDRHLENVLIDKTDGSIVAIDFGHAFGSGVENLGVPEIVPFRLTRQITSLMGPLFSREEENIFSQSMTHCLIALREQKELLLNVMEVFIKEPLTDWLKFAERQSAQQRKNIVLSINSEPSIESIKDSDDEESQVEYEHIWYPKNKINIAKRKLELENPVDIMCEEVKNNRQIAQVYKQIKKVVRGDASSDYRAKVGEICASEKQQVMCLIDLATDPNVLGRMWVGWSSWI